MWGLCLCIAASLQSMAATTATPSMRWLQLVASDAKYLCILLQAVILVGALAEGALLTLLQLPAAASPMWLPALAGAWALLFPVALLLQASSFSKGAKSPLDTLACEPDFPQSQAWEKRPSRSPRAGACPGTGVPHQHAGVSKPWVSPSALGASPLAAGWRI